MGKVIKVSWELLVVRTLMSSTLFVIGTSVIPPIMSIKNDKIDSSSTEVFEVRIRTDIDWI